MPEIQTENLELVLKSMQAVLASIEALSPAARAEVSPVWMARVRAAAAPDPWLHGFTIVQRGTGVVVGQCGFKGPPDADGAVEIAYGVDPEHQGRGYATEAAWAMTQYALDSGVVRVVRAHTLPHESASTRVLTKCGFSCLGEVVDPEDGRVWRWELEQS